MDFEIAYACRTELVALSSHVVMRITDGHRSTIADYDRFEAAVTERFAGASTYGVLQVIHHGTPTPAPDIWRHAAQLADKRPPGARVVVARLGLGFWATAVSGLLSSFVGMLQLGDIRVETSIEAATQALALELIGLNPDALSDAYEQLYAHMQTL